MVDGADATSIKEIHRIPVAIHRQMVDDPQATSIEEFHRNPRSHQSPDGGRSRCDANRRIPPRGRGGYLTLVRLFVRVHGFDPKRCVHFHRNPRSHHRQMVDDPDATSIEDLHRVAAVATWRRCESDEKIET